MRHLTFERRDKWCYGIAMLGFLATIVLLFSAHRQAGLTFSSIVVSFTFAYAFARGHATVFTRRKDSDEKDDHVA